MVSAKLFLKVIGKDIGEFGRFANKHGFLNFVNKNCTTFDFVKGFSPKNGHFNILSFKDAEGRLIERTINFTDSSKRIANSYYYEPEFGLRGRSMSSLIWEGTKFKYDNSKNVFDCGKHFRIEEITNSSHYNKKDIKVGIYSVTEKPKEVSWAISKRNPVPKNFNINGIKEDLKPQDAEYLPILLGPIKSYSKKAEYLAEVHKKRLGLRGIVPKIQTESVYQMTEDCSAAGLTNPLSGKITIGYLSEEHMVRCVGHEFQHAKDFSDMYRLESNALKYLNNPTLQENIEIVFPGSKRFVNKSINKGLIKDSQNTKYLNVIGDEIQDYGNLCSKLGHDNLLCEQRAISAGEKEMQKYTRAKSWVERNLGTDCI